MLLAKIFFFSKQAKSNFEIEVSIFIESNIKVIFYPLNSIVIDRTYDNFTLESPFELNETLIDINTSTLSDLLQKIMYGFVSHNPNFIYDEPFLNINRDITEWHINTYKKILGITV